MKIGRPDFDPRQDIQIAVDQGKGGVRCAAVDANNQGLPALGHFRKLLVDVINLLCL
jgi:hypothetical protein